MSPPLQNTLSLHEAALFGCWQAADEPLQMSLVQTLPSLVQPVLLETNASATQVLAAPLQFSGRSHSPALARQVVAEEATASTGHDAEAPLQVSCTSQTPLAVRQTVVVPAKASAGQLVLLPLQVSIASQTPADARHGVPALPAWWVQADDSPSQTSSVHGWPSLPQAVSGGATSSTGQFLPAPSQVSALSHSPALARQTTADVATASPGHTALPPVHVSARSQMPPAARQVVVEAAKVLAGQDVFAPLQVSCTSQTPADARQIVPALPAGCVHVADEPLQTSSVQGWPSLLQSVPAGANSLAGQVLPSPSQVSATSHSPALVRQVVAPDATASAPQAAALPLQVS